MVSLGKIVSSPATLVEGNEVASVIGLRTVAWGASDGSDPESTGGNGVLGLLSSRNEEVSGWQQQTVELYDSLNHVLYRYLRGLGLSADAAEDVIQETFLRLAGHLSEGGSDGNLRSWLFQVAHNLSMDVHRASRRDHPDADAEYTSEKELIDPKADPESVYLQKERFKHLRKAMSQLTRQQCSSILLRAEGLRYREIAVVLGVSEQRAIHLVKRGLVRLAEGV